MTHEAVDAAMDLCRQGDYFLGEYSFVSLSRVTTENSDDAEWAEQPVAGLVLVSQSCDIARTCRTRPLVELCPLVEVEDAELQKIIACERVRFAALPSLCEQRLVVDLDRTMTAEKAVVAKWTRSQGPSTDSERRDFARALSRKRLRFAFPDDFNKYVQPLRRRLLEKHGKESPEGAALRALVEVRVLAEPSWDSPAVQLTFFFVRNTGSATTFGGRRWDQWNEDWIDRLVDAPRFKNPEGLVVDYGSMTAAEYLESDGLDLEYLSVA